MRVLNTLRSKAAWRLARLHHPDGRVQFHTGMDLTDAQALAQFRRDTAHRNLRVELGPNVVVQAALAPRGRAYGDFLFEDVDDRFLYHVNLGGALALLQALADARLRGGGDAITGQFTFACRSGQVTLRPWDGTLKAARAEQKAIEGVPDLSDFIKDLGGLGGAPERGR